ncbi:MAG: hypothetical protein K8S56_01305 [Candidatus Cloacimonetes bacterium]|nr:hypothetical protein [Candidatus Cloacimonadota bacterium]
MRNILLFLLLFLCLAEISNAQEVQIPIDKEGRIDYISSKLERKLELFTEYSNFREARLFQITDSTFVLEISYRENGKTVQSRLLFTTSEAEIFQQKVTDSLEAKKPGEAFNQDGRTKLIVGSMALSLGYYGWAVPAICEVSDAKGATALYMLTSSAGFDIPFASTSNIPVTDAAATLNLYGKTRGIAHGTALSFLFSDDPSFQGVLATGMLASITEGFVGFHVASNTNMSAGTAMTIGIGGDYGMALGLGAAHLLDFIDNNESQAIAGSVLLGAGLGLWSGKRLSDNQPYTKGDARVLGSVGFLGYLIPVTLIDICDMDEDKAYTTAGMLGVIAGLNLGHKLVKGKNFTNGQGILIELGELAGGLLGLGMAYLVSSDNDDSSKLYSTFSSIGAAGGFWLMYSSYAESARIREKDFPLSIDIKPEGFLALAMKKNFAPNREITLPLLSLTYKF